MRILRKRYNLGLQVEESTKLTTKSNCIIFFGLGDWGVLSCQQLMHRLLTFFTFFHPFYSLFTGCLGSILPLTRDAFSPVSTSNPPKVWTQLAWMSRQAAPWLNHVFLLSNTGLKIKQNTSKISLSPFDAWSPSMWCESWSSVRIKAEWMFKDL